jgi:hypothetical protein
MRLQSVESKSQLDEQNGRKSALQRTEVQVHLQPGCYGRIELGELPPAVAEQLENRAEGYLEYAADSCALEVRLEAPSPPDLGELCAELVRFLCALPSDVLAKVRGGEIYARAAGEDELVRLRVEPGGQLVICWSPPQYTGTDCVPYTGQESLVPADQQRLNGCLSLATSEPRRVAREFEVLAERAAARDGEFIVLPDEEQGVVRIELRDVCLDVETLIARLRAFGSPSGRVEVSSFAAADPEQTARLLFVGGRIFIERPRGESLAPPANEKAWTARS